MIRAIFILTLCISLGACSSEKSGEATTGSVISGLVKARIAKRNAPAPTTAAVPQVSREALDKISQPVIRLSVPKRQASVLLVRSAQNNGANTYQGKIPISVTLVHGLVSATRGLGDDLLAQKLSIPNANLFRGTFPKTVTRTQKYIDGENNLISKEYNCTLTNAGSESLLLLERTHQTHRIVETCRNTLRAFQNQYWVDIRSTQIWKSQQSVSQDVGHVVIETLKSK